MPYFHPNCFFLINGYAYFSFLLHTKLNLGGIVDAAGRKAS